MPPPVRVPSLARSANARLQSGFDVFLSHNWGMDSLDRQNHSRVSRVNDVLRQAGFRTWFDEDRMHGDINAAMSSGIDLSEAVVVFVTANYIAKVAGEGPRGANDNCKLEFDYSLRRKSPDKMIACVMEPACFDTSLWHGAVGMTLGGRLYIDLSKDDDAGFLAGIKKLVDEICKVTDALPPVGDLTLGAPPPARLSGYPDLAFDRYAAQKLFHQIRLNLPGTQLVHEAPYIFLVPNFLSKEECDQLVLHKALASAAKQKPSATFAEQEAVRTSTTVYPTSDELPAGLRERIARLANVGVEHLEPTKLTQYGTEQFFRLHTDATFVKAKTMWALELRKAGLPSDPQATAQLAAPSCAGGLPSVFCTVFVYLNDVDSGGCTRFPYVNVPGLPFYTDVEPGADPSVANGALLERYEQGFNAHFNKLLKKEEPAEPGLNIRPVKGMAALHFPSLAPEFMGLMDMAAWHESEAAVDSKYILQQFIWSTPFDPDAPDLDPAVKSDWEKVRRDAGLSD